MGLYDRDYTQDNFRSQFSSAPRMRMSFPVLTPVVKKLLIINAAVFVLMMLIKPLADFCFNWLSIYPFSIGAGLQIWRLVTYQFLHSGFFHILFNMWALWMFGPTLEKHWGSKRFLRFYLGCGIAGGLFYTLLVSVGFLPPMPMVGASGAILGMLAACAILFPHFVVFLLFFPVPIRVATIVLTVIYFIAVATQGANAGGDAAHLAGMTAGALYVWFGPTWENFVQKSQLKKHHKYTAYHQALQIEVDRILKKVHTSGIHSLTRKEKAILKKATQTEQNRTHF